MLMVCYHPNVGSDKSSVTVIGLLCSFLIDYFAEIISFCRSDLFEKPIKTGTKTRSC